MVAEYWWLTLIFTVILYLAVQACKNASLSLDNVVWYVLHTVQSRSSAATVRAVSGIVLFILLILA